MDGFIPFDRVEYPIEYLPAAAITPKIGMALAMNNAGNLAASATPKYICLTEGKAAVAAGTIIPVMVIDKEIRFSAKLDAATSFKAGTVAQITADGMTVDADGSTNGVFLLEQINSAAAGGEVIGRFVG